MGEGKSVRTWNAHAYDRVSDPQFNWGVKVLERVCLRGDETVLDAGCGTGRLTRLLLERLPHGLVIAVDASSDMVGKAKENLSDFGNQVSFRVGDLREIDLGAVADGVFSTATFHWIPERQKLFSALHAALRPRGWLVAQCGGGNSLERFWNMVGDIVERPPFTEYVRGRRRLQEYLDPEETSRQLREAGFADSKVWTQSMLVQFPTPDDFAEFITTVNLAEHVKFLPEELKVLFIAEVTRQSEKSDPPLALDYIRLNIDARRD